MSDAMATRNRELVLPPNTFAFVLDNTKGKVSVYVAPTKNSLSETDQPVRWDYNTKRFSPCNLNEAIQTFATASEGEYIVLSNPASGPSNGDAMHPPKGLSTEAVDLEVGKKVIIPGPVSFPLWPGQSAETIEGHHLRHNQYVLVRVYDAVQAQENARNATIAPQAGGEDEEVDVLATDFAMGQLIVIPGTSVSFYMPATGFEVLREEGGDTGVSIGSGRYVRDAPTLETMEYCVLLDESGTKRYVRGPAVVFPRPTETFRRNRESGNSRRFPAIELNDQSGIYVKVIEEYRENGETHPVGEELFITGKEQAIYFPRSEHSIIQYGDSRRHFATAIPAGEGRYVLNRETGEVDLITGPAMFLADPRTSVVVRRILDPHDVALMYPGNAEALQINQRYQQESDAEEEYFASASASALPAQEGFSALSADPGHTHNVLRSAGAVANYASSTEMPASRGLVSHSGTTAFGGDATKRRQGYTPPRTITLDTKYEGAVAINIWPGYAVLFSNKTGDRRVEIGPKTVLLEYDETVMALELSTGRPKSDTNILRTGYLRVLNNVVSDLIQVETRDLVKVDVVVSYRVNFEGDEPLLWFSVENYVQLLVDHARSKLRGAAKRESIRDFYTDTIEIVRDTLLGERSEDGRVGLVFEENGMRVYDVEVLNVTIRDAKTAALLLEAQGTALRGAVELQVAEDRTERNAKLGALRLKDIEVDQTVFEASHLRDLAQQASNAKYNEQSDKFELTASERQLKLVESGLVADQRRLDFELSRSREMNAIELARLSEEVEQFVKRAASIQPGMVAALQAFGDRALVESITKAIAPAALAAGTTTADILAQMFKGTPLESVTEMLSERPLANALLNGEAAE